MSVEQFYVSIEKLISEGEKAYFSKDPRGTASNCPSVTIQEGRLISFAR